MAIMSLEVVDPDSSEEDMSMRSSKVPTTREERLPLVADTSATRKIGLQVQSGSRETACTVLVPEEVRPGVAGVLP